MRPTRCCIVCKKRDYKDNLVRIVSINNSAKYDKNKKENKRAIYLCKDVNCMSKAIKLIDKNKLNVKINVDKESLKNIIKEILDELGE